MSIFKSEYTLDVNNSEDDTKALFEKYFQNMAEKGYSKSTVILNPDYGRKKFTGTVDGNGVYNARLIVSKETDEFYRSALLNKIEFTGDRFNTKVKVSVKTTKFGLMFLALLMVAVLIFAIAAAFISDDIQIVIVLGIIGSVVLLSSMIPLLIARHRVNAAKEELLYILKYSDKL